MLTLIHYGELFLKGKNRRFFENKLIENIRLISGGKASMADGRIVLKGGDKNALKYVPGIAWYAQVETVDKDPDSIRKSVVEKIAELVDGKRTFGVFVKRADKRFPINSMEFAAVVGGDVVSKYDLKVDLTNPDIPIYIEIAPDNCYLHTQRERGIGGLPVGSAGKVLCLLSGGIDSPAAAYSMMKRGCKVDFIHFHVFPSNEAVEQTKIPKIVAVLNKFQGESRLYLAPYSPFQLALFAEGVGQGYEMILFRRFIVRVVQKIAFRRGYKAMVTGDSLGQVASQTLENLAAVHDVSEIPILQPLISYDKVEIVELANKIGTYKDSIEPYKDCCSIIVSHPKTKAKLERVRSMEASLDMEGIINRTLEMIDHVDIKPSIENRE